MNQILSNTILHPQEMMESIQFSSFFNYILSIHKNMLRPFRNTWRLMNLNILSAVFKSSFTIAWAINKVIFLWTKYKRENVWDVFHQWMSNRFPIILEMTFKRFKGYIKYSYFVSKVCGCIFHPHFLFR